MPRAIKVRSASGPRPRRRAERRRAPIEPVAGGGLEGRLFKGSRAPLHAALEGVRRARGVTGAWRRLLRRLGPSRKEYEALAAMDLAGCYRRLLAGSTPRDRTAKGPRDAAGDEAYYVEVDRRARALMRSGVPEEQAVAAVGIYLEACLRHVREDAEIRALARLTAATQRILVFAYAEERSAGLNRLDDRERQKLSSDLHDEVGADLIVLKLYVELIAVKLGKRKGVPIGRLREVLVLIGHAIESVRRLTLDLGPALLELGFLPAVRLFVRQFSARTRIKVVLDEEGAALSLPTSHETALYRVLRGALSNVAKHSRARHVTVTLRGAPDAFVLVVADDGKGFDALRQSSEESFGLAAMRERIRSLRGRLHIESRTAARPGERSGTRVEVHLPLRRRGGV